MLEQIRAALADVGRRYGDARVHFCRLEAAALDWGRCALSGAVLDEATLVGVTAALAARFPAIIFDTAAVHVLRSGDLQRLTVATNVTGLYLQPSFLAEMVGQLLNGGTVDLLQQQDRWAFVSVPGQASGEAGYLGWAYRPYLTDAVTHAPTHIVCEPVSLLRAAPEDVAPLLTRVLGGTAVAIGEETKRQGDKGDGLRDVTVSPYHRVTLAGGLSGWVPATHLRPLDTLPRDAAAQRSQICTDAARFIGVPYLWGGGTAFGIDCSGFAQMLHRLIGATIPRDADMQFDAGKPVGTPYQPGDLLFFSEGDRRKITHVGVSLGGWRMIHSSRSRNGVYEDDVQAVTHLREGFVGVKTFLHE